MNTKENKPEYLFSESDIDWQELADIGILRDELELSGQMDSYSGARRPM